MKTAQKNSAFCPTCNCFREGSIQIATTSHRKNYYKFCCEYCLMTSEGYIIHNRGKKKR